jgi:hypothetical protein
VLPTERGKAWVGYKVHLTESCGEGQLRLWTSPLKVEEWDQNVMRL